MNNDDRWLGALEQIMAVCDDNRHAEHKDMALKFIIHIAMAALDAVIVTDKSNFNRDGAEL